MRKTIAIAALAASIFAAGAASAEPVKLRVQYGGSVPGQFGPILEAAAPLGIYKHYGRSYTIESLSLRGSGPAMSALAANEIDVGALSYETLGTMVLTAKIEVRAIADVLGNGMGGFGDDYFLARKGEIKTINDVKGKVAAIISRGSAPDTALRRLAMKAGLRHGEDYTVIEVPLPGMIPALESKRIDLGFAVEPFTGIAERSGKYDLPFSYADALGATQTVVWVSKAEFIAKNRAAMVDFIEDHIRLRHWCFDPANRAKVLDLVMKVTKQPLEAIDYVFTKRDHWRDPDARPDLALLQQNVDSAKEMGLLSATFRVADYADMSLIEEALKRIK